MDRELWKELMGQIRRACRQVRRELGPEKKVRYPDRLIVAMYCWAVGHDRPLCWACERDNYDSRFRPCKLVEPAGSGKAKKAAKAKKAGKANKTLPSVSQFCRRVKSERTDLILQKLHWQLSGTDVPARLSMFDGKLLPVALHSKDVDATKVRTNGGYVRGYRLHAWVNEAARVAVWAVTGAGAGEQTVAQALCPHLPPLPPDALILGDVRFDSADLYAAVAGRGGALFTPLQRMSASEKKRRAMGPARHAAIIAWEQHPHLARMVLRERVAIERAFGTLACTAGGMSHLPAWVRTLDRVKRWVGVKVILHNAHAALRERAAGKAA